MENVIISISFINVKIWHKNISFLFQPFIGQSVVIRSISSWIPPNFDFHPIKTYRWHAGQSKRDLDYTLTTHMSVAGLDLKEYHSLVWSLDNTTYFEESFQIVHLSHGHSNKDQTFKESPPNYTAVGTVVNGSMYPITDFHILLFVLDSC